MELYPANYYFYPPITVPMSLNKLEILYMFTLHFSSLTVSKDRVSTVYSLQTIGKAY